METNHTPSGDGVTRRELLRLGAAGGLGLLCGGKIAPVHAGGDKDRNAPWFEATIPELQRLMATRQLSSRRLTLAYLHRIKELNPLLNAVIETNPAALAIAVRRDVERHRGRIRGPLHGIPVLLKDNIATRDFMQTTAGSLALVGSRVPRDARLVARLRAAGAVILGKANLSEWANYRGLPSINGWSARGGFTRNPYQLDFDVCGSSSGSAVGPAANLCAGAVGTETDGSILCPAGNNLVVGIKPTLGLISQRGIIPIGASQDTAGPMARTVTDAAIMLGAMRSPFGEVAERGRPPYSYTRFLKRGALRGARIGVDERYFQPEFGGEAPIVSVVEQALKTMKRLGAKLVKIDTGDPNAWFEAEFLVLNTEFKVQIAEYLSELRGTDLRTLEDLIAFNRANCRQEMQYFGQEIWEQFSLPTKGLDDPDYIMALALSKMLTRDGIDNALRRKNLDAIVAPSYSFASSVSAVAGYPSISLPVGIADNGWPAGLWMYSGFLREPELLALAYDLEQELEARTPPEFLGTVPPEPPDPGICDNLGDGPLSLKQKRRAWPTLGRGRSIG